MTSLKHLFTGTKLSLITACCITQAAWGGESKVVIDDKNPTACLEDPSFCKLFGRSTLYENENNCLIQKVKMTGRYHGQHHSTTLDFDNTLPGQPNRFGASYWEHRRYRMGIEVDFLNDFNFYAEMNMHDNDLLIDGGYYNNIDIMGIIWKPTDDFYINVGKQKPKITREWSTSSRTILTVERSLITNEVIPPYAWGTTVGFKLLGLNHEVGGWLNAAYERDTVNQPDGPHWPVDNTRGALSYRTNVPLNDSTKLFFDYLFTNNSDGQVDGAGTAGISHEDTASQYNHVFSIGTESSWSLGACDRKFALLTDFILGVDREGINGNNTLFQSNNLNAGEDVFGFVILPSYDLTERLQLVGRYAYASEAAMQRGQRAPFRDDWDGFAARPATPILEDVHTLYLGFNYRLCGDQLKLLGGYEYLTGDVESAGARDNGGVTGNTWLLGVRTYW